MAPISLEKEPMSGISKNDRCMRKLTCRRESAAPRIRASTWLKWFATRSPPPCGRESSPVSRIR